MTERTRQNILGVFLAGVLGLSVGAVWIFASQRRAEVTALSEPISVAGLGFSIRMPKGWEPKAVGRTLFGNGLIYRRAPNPRAGLDKITATTHQRHLFVLAVVPNATDEQILAPLDKLVSFWDRNHNLFRYLKPEPFPFAAWRPDALGYERRDGSITFLNIRRGARSTLIRYQQIKAQGRVFWCVMAGNTQLDEADKALLKAVASSFELLREGSSQKVDQS